MININLKLHNYKDLVEKHKVYLENYIEKRYSEKENSFKHKDAIFFKDYLGRTTSEVAKKLLDICTSSDLKKIAEDFEIAYLEHYRKDFKAEAYQRKKSKTIKHKQISKYLDYILNYDGFNKGTGNWNRHKFLSKLGVKVCPYCNRNYITTYIEDTFKTTADADHYYPKWIYPILQMNLYNMIPCCNVCNSKMKGAKDIRHLYPYKDLSSSLKFSTNIDTLETLYNFTEDIVKINITPYNQEAQNSVEIFKLHKVYEIHKDIIFGLKRKIYAYEAFQREYYNKMLGDELGNRIFNGIDVDSYWFDFLNKDPLDEPLAKMKQDIYKQLTSK